MKQSELKERTKDFGCRIMKMVENLPSTKAGQIIADQILRSGFSIGANYRAACRAKSTKDFINKLKIVEEESDEVTYWIEIIIKTGLIKEDKMIPLLDESNELTAIFVSSLKTMRQKLVLEREANRKSKIVNRT